jgi:hypothetical protein
MKVVCTAWRARAVKMGYRWKVGNDKKVLFWEDIWFGNCSLDDFF